MKIHTLWKLWDHESLELLFALDEGTIEENWDAWVDGCKAARERYGLTEADTREVIITVSYESVLGAFLASETTGTVES